VQTTNINKVGTFIFYQLAKSLLVIELTYLEGRDGDVVVNRPYGWEDVPMFNARINISY